MKWVCNCYGSTEARSFPGSIITLPSFDEKTIILDFRRRTINLVLTHPSTCLSPFVRLMTRKEKKKIMGEKTDPIEIAWNSHVFRLLTYILVGGGRQGLWRRRGRDKGNKDDRYDDKKKKATMDSKS